MIPVNRPLEIEWILDFQALANSGNFSRAAQSRNIAQPAFSRHIRSLEEWAGLTLVDRSSHPISITPAGNALLPYFLKVIDCLDMGKQEAHKTQAEFNRKLQFAATHALSMAFFPKWLMELETMMNLGPIQMVSDSYQACEELMLQRKVQCLLTHGHASLESKLTEPDFLYKTIEKDMLIPVAAPAIDGSPLYFIDEHSKTIIPLLAYSQESRLGQILRNSTLKIFSNSNFVTSFTSHHAVLLKTMAIEGRGIAWLPESLISDELKNKKLVHASSKEWEIPIEIRLYRQNDLINEAMEAVWKFISKKRI